MLTFYSFVYVFTFKLYNNSIKIIIHQRKFVDLKSLSSLFNVKGGSYRISHLTDN
jgi:hypothetical protein